MTLNPNYVLQPFDSLIASSESFVLLGLRLVEKVESFPEPTEEEKNFAFQMNLGGQNFVPSTSKLEFKKWILKKGFEDLHKSIRVVLERTFVYKSMEEIVKTGGPIDFDRMEKELQVKASNFYFDQLVKNVSSFFAEVLKYEKHILSFNNARNCLIHTNGTVTARHCNNGKNDQLKIHGERFKLFFKNDDGEKPMRIGEPGPENAALMMSSESFEINTPINADIELDLKQFTDILNTTIFIRADLAVKLGL